MRSPSSSSSVDRLRSPVDEVAVALRFAGAPPARRVDPARPGARSQGRPQRDLELRPSNVALAAAPGLPRDRGPEGRNDRAVRLSPLAPRHHRAVMEGGQLLRPPLVARRGLVPRSVPRAGRGTPRGRGKPELPLPPARARARPLARPGREADRARAQPGRPRLLAVPARGRARPRAAHLRGRARRRGGTDTWRGGAPGCGSSRVQPGVVGPHLRSARTLRGAARTVAHRLPARATARGRYRGPGGEARRDVRLDPRV